MKLTVTKAYNDDKNKAGVPYLTKTGKQQYRSRIQTVERGEEWLSGFVFKQLQAGEVIEADLTNDPKYGMQFRIAANPAAMAGAAQSDSAVTAELKNHTIFLKQILTTLEGMAMSMATHQTIEAIKKPAPAVAPVLAPVDTFDEGLGEIQTDALEVSDEDDFGDPLGGDDPFGH